MSTGGLWAEMGEEKKERFHPHSPVGRGPFSKSSGQKKREGKRGAFFLEVVLPLIPNVWFWASGPVVGQSRNVQAGREV